MPTMTPDFSRQAALIADSPYWQNPSGWVRWDKFLRSIARYPTFDSLPDDLKAEWRTAEQWQRDNHDPDPWPTTGRYAVHNP